MTDPFETTLSAVRDVMAAAQSVSPSSDNPVRVALLAASRELEHLARDYCPTFGHSPCVEHLRSRAGLVKELAKITDAILSEIGKEGAYHTHGRIPADDYETTCADAVYDRSLADRFDIEADRLRDERREFGE